MNNTEGKIGIIREQGEFFDHKPLSEEDEKLYREQQHNVLNEQNNE